MTKTIRIENGDAGTQHKVRVYQETRLSDGTWERDPTPIALDFPTAITERTIWAGKRLVVEEAE